MDPDDLQTDFDSFKDFLRKHNIKFNLCEFDNSLITYVLPKYMFGRFGSDGQIKVHISLSINGPKTIASVQ